MAGLSAATLGGLLYLLSLSFLSMPTVSVAILLAGRAVLGGAESFIITGATTWGLVRVGAHNAGKVIAWMGTAMFAAFAAGAPLGTALYGQVVSARWHWPRLSLRCDLASDCAAPGCRAGPKGRPEHPVHRQPDLVARVWRRPEQRRFRRNHRFQLTPLRRARVDPCLAPFSAYAVALILPACCSAIYPTGLAARGSRCSSCWLRRRACC